VVFLGAVLFALGVAAQHLPLTPVPGRKIDLCPAVYFAAVLLLGPWVAVPLVGLCDFTGQSSLLLRRDPGSGRPRSSPRAVVFNTAQWVVAVGLGGLAFRALSGACSLGGSGEAYPDACRLPGAAALAATMYLVSTGTVAVMIGLHRGRSPLAAWRAGRRRDALESAAQFLLGLGAAWTLPRYPWALLFLLVVGALLHRSQAQALALGWWQAAVDDLRQQVRLRDELLGTVSHELRAPLSAVHGYAELLRGEVAQHDEQGGSTTRLADRVLGNAQRLSRMVDDLLDLAHIERDSVTVYPEPLDLVPVLQQVAGGFRRQPGGEQLVLALPPALPAFADAARVAQAVTNLLTNALKYAPGGPVVLRAGPAPAGPGAPREPGAPEVPAFVRVEVQDAGPGIPPAEQGRVWEKFYRGPTASAAGARGMGIGLAVVKAVVEAQGGGVGLESAPGAGSRFWLDLPADQGQENDQPLGAGVA
jgi:signal transduction histidine kinase